MKVPPELSDRWKSLLEWAVIETMPPRLTQLGDPIRQARLKRLLPVVYQQHLLQAREDATW